MPWVRPGVQSKALTMIRLVYQDQVDRSRLRCPPRQQNQPGRPLPHADGVVYAPRGISGRGEGGDRGCVSKINLGRQGDRELDSLRDG